MRIAVCSGFEADSIKANALNVMKMAQGFAANGHDVLLIARHDKSGKETAQSLLDRYGIVENIKVRLVPWRSGLHGWFAFYAMCYLALYRPDFVYSRSYILPWLTSQLGIPTAVESHAHVGFNSSQFLKMIAAGNNSALKALVTIAPSLADYYASLGVPAEKQMVLPDAVDVDLFKHPKKLPPSPFAYTAWTKNVVYAGHLYDYKGIPSVIEAAALLPDVGFHFVGGRPADIKKQQEVAASLKVDNVIFHGHVLHPEVPNWLWHADALLLPPSAYHPSAAWTSPMKLGEYLVAGVPIVATDIPALRNWVTDKEVVYVTPDSGNSIAEGINRILSNPFEVEERTKNGLLLGSQWSFAERAKKILQQANMCS